MKAPTTRSTAAGKLFGERLRVLREKRGMTQQALADLVGAPHTHVSQMERGVKLPNLSTVLRLAAALKCKPSKLVSVFDSADVAALLQE